jgi:hypothetical protein
MSETTDIMTAAGVEPLRRLVHLASLVNCDGSVSARCYRRPRAINLKRATWTLDPRKVTCPRCKSWHRKSAGVRA